MKRLGGRAIAGRACLTARDRVVVDRAGKRRELAGAHLILATGAATTRHSPERWRATPSRPAPAPNCAPATPNVRTRSGTVRGLQRHRVAGIGLDDDAGENLGHEPARGVSVPLEPRPARSPKATVRVLCACSRTSCSAGGSSAPRPANSFPLTLSPDRAAAQLHLPAARRYNRLACAEEMLNATETLAAKGRG